MLSLSEYIEKYGLRPCYSNNKELINENKVTEEEENRLKSIRESLRLLADKKIEELVKSFKEKTKEFTKINRNEKDTDACEEDINEFILINDLVDYHFNMVNYRKIIKDFDTDYSSDENDYNYD